MHPNIAGMTFQVIAQCTYSFAFALQTPHTTSNPRARWEREREGHSFHCHCGCLLSLSLSLYLFLCDGHGLLLLLGTSSWDHMILGLSWSIGSSPIKRGCSAQPTGWSGEEERECVWDQGVVVERESDGWMEMQAGSPNHGGKRIPGARALSAFSVSATFPNY